VSSPAEGEGKSTIIANLAVAFAQAGHKTILVDSDLRKPAQHEIWGISSERGLTTMMLEDPALATPPLADVGVSNLQVLPAGPLPQIPADLLGSQRMTEIIGILKARASFVLFDSPPVLAATDTVLLGSRLDGVLLVVRAGHTRRDDTARAKQVLERVHARILGAVLSNAPRENTTAYYG
jgi:non-specific protein-tyrosine kinase